MSLPGSPRLPYDQLPAGLRARIDAAIGSPVVAVSPRRGGFSPGPAVVATCADGTSAFVKAVGTPLDPHTPDLLRNEAAVAAGLPASLPVPRLRAQVEWAADGEEWVALVFGVVDGAPPPLPWTATSAGRAVAAVDRFARLATPCPLPGLRLSAELLSAELSGWRALAAEPPPDLHPWEVDHLDWLTAVPDRLAQRGGLAGDTLVHLDLRADNLLFTPDGGVVLLDWAWACRGAAWIDVVLLALDVAVHGDLDPESLVAGLPAVAAADPRDPTDLLAGLAGMWAVTMRRPSPPGLPTLRAFQRRFHDAALEWVQRRVAAGG
ncbi:hypothetical protein [Modestobacter sp. URMC 112]